MSLYFSNINDRKYNTWCKYTIRLDTYGCGCEHDCCYCYAKSLLNFRGLWNSKAPKAANLYEIKNTISRIPKGSIIKLGGMTDCFMPSELQKQITYKTIQILNFYKIHYLIVTKSHIVAHDEYLKIYDKNLAHFQISITSTSNEISKKNENASLPKQRIKAIEKLYSNGFDVSLRLSPFIPEFIDLSIINTVKCDKILIEFLKVNHWIKKQFDIDYSKYTLKYGGYEHLELTEKIKHVSQIIGFKQKSVGEYVKDHYEYFKNNVNFNKSDCCNLNFMIINKPMYLQTKILFE